MSSKPAWSHSKFQTTRVHSENLSPTAKTNEIKVVDNLFVLNIYSPIPISNRYMVKKNQFVLIIWIICWYITIPRKLGNLKQYILVVCVDWCSCLIFPWKSHAVVLRFHLMILLKFYLWWSWHWLCFFSHMLCACLIHHYCWKQTRQFSACSCFSL